MIDIFKLLRQKYFSNIYFWIILFFVLRLYGISDAPLESAHNWRQCFTNSIARSFFQDNNPSFFYPKSAIYGDNSGIVGTEFPLFNYLIYLISKIFGYTHWYGRLINLVVSSIGILFFYKLIKKIFTEDLAFYSSILLMCSLWFIFSRKSMPDTFSVSLVIIGIYYGISYFDSLRAKQLIFFFLFFTLGLLSKIPAIYIAPIFLYYLLNLKVEKKAKFYFSITALLSVSIVLFWYFKWVPHLESIDGNKLYFPRSIAEGTIEIYQNKWNLLEKFYFSSLQSFIAFFFFLIGLYYFLKRKIDLLFYIFIIVNVIFAFFIIKTGVVFPTHSYYIIPYTPIMALFVGYALVKFNNYKAKILFVFFIISEALLNQQNDFRINNKELAKLRLENIATQISKTTDLVASNGGESPQMLYFINRRGWRLNNNQVHNPGFIQSITNKGCKFLFLNKNELNLSESNLDYKKVYSDDDFVVYKLN